MLQLGIDAGGFEYDGRGTGQRGVQRFALGGTEVRIFRAPDYDREGVENLPDLRADMRLVARNGTEHVSLGLKVGREFGDHALVDKFGHRGQVEKARLDLRADALRR